MTDETVLSSPSIGYQILLFVIIQAWALMTYETAQYQLLLIFETPLNWILWSIMLMGTLAPVVYAIVWRAKQQVTVGSLEWNHRDRDVTLDEYREMTNQYARDYQYMISRVDFGFLLLSLMAGVILVLAPFLLMRTNALLISLAPATSGLAMLIFAVLLLITIFRAAPSSVSDQFPYHPPRQLARANRSLVDIPGVSWVGVRLVIGESEGLYTLRSPRPVMRVEDIEGIARIECEIDRTGRLESAAAIIERYDGDDEYIDSLDSPITRLGLTKLVRVLLVTYIDERGDEAGILGEIVEEVDRAIASMVREE
ncbi:hypothetical protein EU545_05845 [Candidatus Thorarchaeota archaeon]|nr:MAG: hypothetical protein EU545_05845 [Candidatus Thorarchaeota archaeon]